MEQGSGDSEFSSKKSKLPHSKIKEYKSQCKKQRTSEEEVSLNVDSKFESFSDLPFELKYQVLMLRLRSILEKNIVFRPLDGVKEFLDALSMVNKECNAIATDLGRCNKLTGENTEPKYKIMVKNLWVPNDFLSKEKGYLDRYMGCVLSPECIVKLQNSLQLQKFCFMAAEKNPSEATIARVLNDISLVSFKGDQERAELAAVLLIAGADANYYISDTEPLIIFLAHRENFHTLIPLMFLKRVNIDVVDLFRNTTLMQAVRFPKILEALLAYNPEGINLKNNFGSSALDAAVVARNRDSVAMLLERKAQVGDALRLITICTGDVGAKCDIELDKAVAELLIQFGPEIKFQYPVSHPGINQSWLKHMNEKYHSVKKN